MFSQTLKCAETILSLIISGCGSAADIFNFTTDSPPQVNQLTYLAVVRYLQFYHWFTTAS